MTTKTISEVIKIISDYYGVDILKQSRASEIVKARKMCCYVIKPMFKLTEVETAEKLNYKSLSSVSYNINTLEHELRFIKQTQKEYEEIKELITSNKIDVFIENLTNDEFNQLINKLALK